MMRPLSLLLDLLFPPSCPFCRKLLPHGAVGLCPGCQQSLPWLVGKEGEQSGEFFAKCVAPLQYRETVRASIHRYKFQGRRGYAEVYGTLIAQCVRDSLAGEYDLISWVPLSQKRLRERGYDQSFLLARRVAAVLGTTAVPTLRKVRHTGSQSKLDSGERRRANVLGAYEAINPQNIANKRILLIDDVVTTGATLGECARILRTAGADRVVCAVLARAR